MKITFQKALFTTTTLFFCSIALAQITLPKMTYEQSQDATLFEKVRNNTKLLEYITASGNSVKVGDTLIIGKPTSSEASTTAYGNSSLRTTNRKQFEYIQLGRPAGFGAIMGAMNGQAPAMAGINLSNETVLVQEIKVMHKGSKKKPLNVFMVLGEINGRAFGVNKYLTIQDAEGAIELGEVYLKNRKMTREEAIAKLKESKELLDLEMMSQEEYDKLKAELSPIIMGSN